MVIFSNYLKNFLKNFCFFPELFSPRDSEKARRSSFCLLFRFLGVSTITLIIKSPFFFVLMSGIPLPFNVNSVPLCVSSGILNFSVDPPRTGTSISAPRAASVNVIGTSQ